MEYNFFCFKCGSTYRHGIEKLTVFGNKYGVWNGIDCIRCQDGMAKMIGKRSGGGLGSGKDGEVASIAYDPKGNEVALNHKGKVVDNKYVGDHRGYKRAGKKKIRSEDQYGNKTGY